MPSIFPDLPGEDQLCYYHVIGLFSSFFTDKHGVFGYQRQAFLFSLREIPTRDGWAKDKTHGIGTRQLVSQRH